MHMKVFPENLNENVIMEGLILSFIEKRVLSITIKNKIGTILNKVTSARISSIQ